MPAGLIGGAVEKVELEIGEAVLAQPPKQLVEKLLDLWVRWVEDVVRAAEPWVDQRRPIACLQQPLGMGLGKLRVGGDMKGGEPDAEFKTMAMDPGGERVQPGGEELIRDPVAPALPARHPAVIELDHCTEPVGGGLGKLRHSLRQEGGVAGDIALGHREAEVVPAAPATWHGGEIAGAGSVSGGGECLTQGCGAILAIKKKDGIGDQSGLRRNLQTKLLGEATALLRFRERRAVLLGDKQWDVGRKRVARVLIAVVVPAEDGREAAGPQHLRDEHRLAVADRGGPPRRRGR